MTVAGWLLQARGRLAPVAGGEADREARLIVAHVTGWSAARVATAGHEDMPESLRQAAEACVARRLEREPLAQILGAWPFWGRSFAVTRDTLVPRPDTETLIDLALARPFETLVDLGTGSGAIAITLLAERPGARGVATDISEGALSVAAQNAHRHGVADRLALERRDWWQGVEAEFDLVLSNPPYVTGDEYAALAPEIRRYEPRAALTPGGDGLAAYRAIAAGLPRHLVPGGRCLVEIGAGQGPAVAAILRGAGLDMVEVHPDINGKDRVVTGAMPIRHDPQ